MIWGRGHIFSVTEPLIPGNLVRPTDGSSVLGTLHHERHEVREHQDTEGENMPPRQHSRPSFISSCEAVKARGPAETALHIPPLLEDRKSFAHLSGRALLGITGSYGFGLCLDSQGIGVALRLPE